MVKHTFHRLKNTFFEWVRHKTGYYNFEVDNLQEQANCALEREKLYVRVLNDYASHQRKVNFAQRCYKLIFFLIVCVAFVFVVAGSVISVLIISIRGDNSWQEIAVAITSVVSLISVIIVLPSKIAEHLFPVAGEKDISGFITKMHEMDTQIIGKDEENIRLKKSEKRDDNQFARSANRYAIKNDDDNQEATLDRTKAVKEENEPVAPL